MYSFPDRARAGGSPSVHGRQGTPSHAQEDAQRVTTTEHLNPHTLGQRIATLRRGQGWTQRRLAEAAGVSHGYVALLELGRMPSPGKVRLDSIARALDLRTSDALLD